MKKIKKLTSAVVSLMMVCTSMGGFAFGTSAEMIVNGNDITITLSKTDELSFSVNESDDPTVTHNGVTNVYDVYEKITLTGEFKNGFRVEIVQPESVAERMVTAEI